jgi:hypothetical protein
MSGRRSNSREGMPVGICSGCGQFISEASRTIGPGFRPSRILMLFSSCSICLSRSGIAAAAVYSSCSAWRTSASVPDPPCSNVSVSCSDCLRASRVRLVISSSEWRGFAGPSGRGCLAGDRVFREVFPGAMNAPVLMPHQYAMVLCGCATGAFLSLVRSGVRGAGGLARGGRYCRSRFERLPRRGWP